MEKLVFIFICTVAILLIAYVLFYKFPSENIYSHGDRKEKRIVLTFDDGPVENTLKIVDILKRENVSATFFVIGRNIEKNPGIFENLIQSGNEIASHGYNHLKLNLLPREKISKEILLTEDILEKYNISNSLFRPSHGFISFSLDSISKKQGKRVILWDVNSYDYKNPGRQKIIDNVLKNVKNGSIILFHDYAYYGGEKMKNTIEALDYLIPELKKRYEIVTVSELLKI